MNAITKWVPSARAQVIRRRTYCRPLETGGFEEWHQVVDRVVQHQRWLWERALGDVPLSDVQQYELEDLRGLLIEHKASLSGRTLWLGGTEISRRREASQFNPLPRNERFITNQGVKSFENFQDGDITTVLTHEGNWKPARVAAAGNRHMLRLGLRRGKGVTSIRTSVDHTWILTGGSRVLASDLQIGDKFYCPPNLNFYDWEFDTALTDEQFYWCYGFVFGDGALAKSGASITSRVRLCSGKSQFLSRFNSCGFGHSYPPSCNGDPFVWTGSYLKTLPTNNDDPRLIRAFLRGYLDADGNKKDQRGQTQFMGMSVSDLDAAAFVRHWAPVFGLYILRDEVTQVPTNYGIRNATEFSFTTGGSFVWKVESIDSASDEECWCLTVDDDHSFVMPNGLVTGNCSFLRIETVHDLVDAFWLLLQGCGVGFEPVVGNLSGFTKPAEIEVVRSQRHKLVAHKGRESTTETLINRVWTITIGDSAEAWAKSIGKIVAQKKSFNKIVLDFSQIRPAGYRLKGYGWISSGDDTFCKALTKICEIMNRQAGKLLTRIDIIDVMNWLGTTLSSRRSAEIAIMPYGGSEWETFARMKLNHWEHNPQRSMSNNSLLFYRYPGREALVKIFDLMKEAGGSEPGFINAEQALARAPWFKGPNPCAEILLPNKGFCNLVEINLARFNDDPVRLHHAIIIMARANYRQTCVNLQDGILQHAWHENNEFLRLCGVGVTGVVGWNHQNDPEEWELLNRLAHAGAHGMADELGLPRSKNVTTVKPSGTLSKVMDTTEGVHKPLGKFIFNNVRFSISDPYVEKLREAGYRIFADPYNADGILVTFPVENSEVEFTEVDGRFVNLESAIVQLDRYKMMMSHYVDQNCSITVSYDDSEVPAIIDWLDTNWDSVVGMSFLYRTDPSKTAADLGYPYLPQEVVEESVFRTYAATLRPMDRLDTLQDVQVAADTEFTVDAGSECAGGVCPVR
jgi:adenosylcobalamin-dependent ribonucleoside-triphosphate reductase